MAPSRCAHAVMRRLGAAGSWLGRLELAVDMTWSEEQLDDELADMVAAGVLQFNVRGRMYRLAGEPIARAALRQMLLEDGDCCVLGRQTVDKLLYRVGVARRRHRGTPDEELVMAALEMPYPEGDPAAMAQIAQTLLGSLA